jgi:hypothetical protein
VLVIVRERGVHLAEREVQLVGGVRRRVIALDDEFVDVANPGPRSV